MVHTPDRTVFTWSTEKFPCAQRLDAYMELLSQSLFTVTTSCPDANGFHCEMKTAPFGALNLAQFGGSAKDSHRTQRDIARCGVQGFILLTMGAGEGYISHRGSALRLRPFDMVLVDTRYEYALHLPAGFLTLIVSLSSEWIQIWIPAPEKLVGKGISAASPWGRVLSGYLSQMTPEFSVRAPLPVQVMTDQLGALLALAATEISGHNTGPAPAYRDLRARILDDIRQRCSEWELTAGEVAEALKLSPRTLHRVLASYGETFRRQLIDARLDVAVRMLESHLFDQVTTAEIGRRAGFSDASHFARVCRVRLGCTPGQLRRACNDPQADASDRSSNMPSAIG
jgi:AraC family transcriptional regulator, positive regulator of tynA and feaB